MSDRQTCDGLGYCLKGHPKAAADALAAKDAEIARLREALASLHNEMTGAFGRIEAVSEAVAKDMRRIARAALNGEAGNG